MHCQCVTIPTLWGWVGGEGSNSYHEGTRTINGLPSLFRNSVMGVNWGLGQKRTTHSLDFPLGQVISLRGPTLGYHFAAFRSSHFAGTSWSWRATTAPRWTRPRKSSTRSLGTSWAHRPAAAGRSNRRGWLRLKKGNTMIYYDLVIGSTING